MKRSAAILANKLATQNSEEPIVISARDMTKKTRENRMHEKFKLDCIPIVLYYIRETGDGISSGTCKTDTRCSENC